jgi:hypothetical protein
MNFRSFEPVNGAPKPVERRASLDALLARRRRRPKAIDRLKTAETRGLHEVDGDPRHTATNADPPNLGHDRRRLGG